MAFINKQQKKQSEIFLSLIWRMRQLNFQDLLHLNFGRELPSQIISIPNREDYFKK